MGLPETASQCLCPLGQGDDDSASSKRTVHAVAFASNRRRSSLPGHLPSDILTLRKARTNERPSQPRPARYQADQRAPSSLSSHLPSRRSTTFYGGENAQQCIEACRQGFLSSLTTPSDSDSYSSSSDADSGTSGDDSVLLPTACSVLSGTAAQEELWQLYWCDSAFCGVWIEADGGIGQDPNVDLIINECQSIGFPSVYDPGPPPANYICSSLLTASPSGNPCRHLAAAATRSSPPQSNMATSTNVRVDPTVTAGAKPTAASTLRNTATALSTMTAAGSSSSAIAATGASGTSRTTDRQDTPSAGAKAAIVICVLLAVVLLAAIVYYFLQKRRSGLGGQPYQHRGGGGSDPGSRDGGQSQMGGVESGESGESRESEGERVQRGQGRSDFKMPESGSAGISLKARLSQSQMRFFPGHFRDASSRHRRQTGDNAPTPLISAANSCNSVQDPEPASLIAGASARLKTASHSVRNWRPSFSSFSSFSVFSISSLFSVFSRRHRADRSISPPLTSLSPPPSPTQLSARGSGGGAAENSSAGYYGYSGSTVPYYFPSSPICAPTTNKLEPRRERTPTIKSSNTESAAVAPKAQHALGYYNFQSHRQNLPPVPPLPFSLASLSSLHEKKAGSPDADRVDVADTADAAGSAHGLRSSYGSYSTATNASIPASSLYGNALTTNTIEPMTSLAGPHLPTPPCPASPARPPRPHESPLEIPDLVMPDPPNLPAPARSFSAAFSTSSLFGGSGGSRSFSMPAAAFTFSRTGTSRNTMSAPQVPSMPPMAAAEPAYTYTSRAEAAFKAHHARAAARAGSAATPPVGPPPTRALPPPPKSEKRLSGTALLPKPQPPPDGLQSTVSVELPPLLVHDDGLDDWGSSIAVQADHIPSGPSGPSQAGEPVKGSKRTAAGTGHAAKAPTSSFSSTMSASSMLSSNTVDTMTTSTTAATSPVATTATAVAEDALDVATSFYTAAPATVSSLTIRPSRSDGSKQAMPVTAKEAADDDCIFPCRSIGIGNDDF